MFLMGETKVQSKMSNLRTNSGPNFPLWDLLFIMKLDKLQKLAKSSVPYFIHTAQGRKVKTGEKNNLFSPQ